MVTWVMLSFFILDVSLARFVWAESAASIIREDGNNDTDDAPERPEGPLPMDCSRREAVVIWQLLHWCL